MQTTKGQWLFAVPVALAVHGAVVAALLLEPDESGASQAGLGGIEVSLGPAGGAPGGAAIPERVIEEPVEEVPPLEAVVAQQAPPEVLVEQQTPVEPPIEEVPQPVSEPVESPPEVEMVAPDSVVTVALAAEPETQPVEEATVVPLHKIAPAVKPTPPEIQETPEPIPEPESVRALEPRVEEPPSDQRPMETAALPPSVAGAGGRSGTKDALDAGDGDNTPGGGLAGDTADYLATLQAWLEKHKKYPAKARRRRQEGTAMLYFVVDKSGSVTGARLEQTSGSKLLDQEVMRMIERAAPLPPMPETMSSAPMELVVPVQFFLR